MTAKSITEARKNDVTNPWATTSSGWNKYIYQFVRATRTDDTNSFSRLLKRTVAEVFSLSCSRKICTCFCRAAS